MYIKPFFTNIDNIYKYMYYVLRTLFDQKTVYGAQLQLNREMNKEKPFEGVGVKANRILNRLITIINEGKAVPEKRYGGVLMVGRFDESKTVLHLTLPFADVPQSELLNYQRWALGKVKSLEENPTHVTSRQSRNPEKDRWGGAIRARDIFLSFSGFEEDEDEALVILVALDLGLTTEPEALEIMSDSSSLEIYRRFKAQ